METSFVSSHFIFKQKEKRPFPLVPIRTKAHFLSYMVYIRGSQPFSSTYPLCTLETFRVPPGYNFLDLPTPNIITCIPLCFNFQTLELFAYPLELFPYPMGLKYPRLRTPDLENTFVLICPAKKIIHFLFRLNNLPRHG